MGDSKALIRPARESDRQSLLEMHRSLYVGHRDAVLPAEHRAFYAYRDFDRVLREDVAALLGDAGIIVLVAERAGRVVGYVSGRIDSEPRRVLARRGVVLDWFVLPEARSDGIGRRLLEDLLTRFRAVGCEAAESTSWSDNAIARRRHEELGFAEVEVRYRMRLDSGDGG